MATKNKTDETNKAQEIQVGSTPGLESLKVFITSAAPLLMHNIQGANPLNPFTLEMNKLNLEKKRIKKDEEAKLLAHYDKMAKVEFMSGLYISKLGPYIPGHMLVASVAKAAGLEGGGWGATISRSLMPTAQGFQLNYEGPRTAEELWEQRATFADQTMVTVGQSKVLRTRPKFNDWSLTASFKFLSSEISKDQLVHFFELAGFLTGIGDGRKLQFGRFNVEVL